MNSYAVLASLLLCVVSNTVSGQGRLQAVREKVRSEDHQENHDHKDDDHDHFDCDDEDDDVLGTIAGKCFFSVIGLPFTVPRYAMSDTSDRWGYFPRFPYDHETGYLVLDPDSHEDRQRTRMWAGRASIENGNNFDGLNRVNFHLLVETTSRFGFQTRWNFLDETLSGNRSDNLITGSTELIYRFAQSSSIQMFAGVGFGVLNDQSSTDWGVNFTYGADIFFGEPFIASLLFDAGTLGSATVYRIRGTMGVVFDRVEIFTGLDYFNVSGVAIWGPLLGMRLWF